MNMENLPKNSASIQCLFSGHIFNTLVIFSESVTASDGYRGGGGYGELCSHLAILFLIV